MASTTYSASVSSYEITSPEFGTCRLKGVNGKNPNVQFYASVGAQDLALNEACGRCIRVSCPSGSNCKAGSSVTAYVLDVCRGCNQNKVQVSSSVLSALAVASNSNSVNVNYKFVACPSDFLAGSVKACLMEGASSTYIPLQFYNSKQILKNVTISHIPASMSKDSFIFSATPNQQDSDSNSWFKKIPVSLVGENNENLTTTFSFSSNSGCASSDVQFSRDSYTAEASDNSSESDSNGGSNLGAILGGIIGSIVVIGIIIAAYIYFRRRKRLGYSKGNQDLGESVVQNVSPRAIPRRGNLGSIDEPAIGSPHSGTYTNAATPGVGPTYMSSSLSKSINKQAPSKTLLDSSFVNKMKSGQDSASVSESGIPEQFNYPTHTIPSDKNGDIYHHEQIRPSSMHTSNYDTHPSYETADYRPSHVFGTRLSSPQSNQDDFKSHTSTPTPKAAKAAATPRSDDENEDRDSFDIDYARQMDELNGSSNRDPYDLQAASIIASSQPKSSALIDIDTDIDALNENSHMDDHSIYQYQDSESSLYGNQHAFTDDQARSSQEFNVDSYHSPAPHSSQSPHLAPDYSSLPLDATTVAHSNRSSDYGNFGLTSPPPPRDVVNEDLPVFSRSQGSSGGYRRGSLNLLGYPYAKRSSRHHHAVE